jgi:two-component system, cell cycle response regulator
MATRILIIEDNPTNMELMVYLLAAFGYTIDKACEGHAGIALALKASPDLIVCDIEMPGISGLDVVKNLHRRPETQRIPMIAVTAYAMVGDRDRILAAGFDGYISKPIDPETFVKEVEAFLPVEKRSSKQPSTHDPATAARKAQSINSPLVLVVDDAAINLTLIKSTLEPSGYRVITAQSVEAALKLARHYPLDLILSDLHLSPDSGLEFLRHVRSDPVLQTIPFVLLTSSLTDPTDRIEESAIKLGADRFLLRPIIPENLLQEVAACLAERQRKPSGGSSVNIE